MAFVVWLEGARPKTLVAGASPVVIGSVIAAGKGTFSILPFLLVLLFALCTQIGTNYANDYYDFIKGADTSERKGPRRLAQAQLMAPHKVLFASFVMFGISMLCSLFLIPVIGFISLLIGISSVFFGIFYTAGRYSLSYMGLGELFVLIFFGIVATCGTEYVLSGSLSLVGFVASFGPGLLSTAIIVVNNLRDIQEDTKAKKRTLAVRFGALFAKNEYLLCILLACSVPVICYGLSPTRYGVIMASLICVPAIPLVKRVFFSNQSESLNGVLGQTGLLLLLYTLLFSLGWML